MILGDHIVEISGKLLFRDEKNQLQCEICIPNPHTISHSIESWFGTIKKQKLPSDYFYGEITHATDTASVKSEKHVKNTADANHKDNHALVHVEGSWLGAIEFNNECYWDIHKQPPLAQVFPINGECAHNIWHTHTPSFPKK